MRFILFIFIVGIIAIISIPILILFFIIRRCKENNKDSVSDNQIEIEKIKYNEAQGYYRNQRIKQKVNKSQNQSQNQKQAQSEKHADTQCQDQTQNHDPDQGQDLSKYYDFIEWLKQLPKCNQNQSQDQSQRYKESQKPKEMHHCPHTPEKEPEAAVQDKEEIKAAQRTQKHKYTNTKSSYYKKYNDKNVYKCKCGICVKSKDERAIADFLYENDILFEYEKESQYFVYDPKWRNLKVKSIHPDFFIKGPIIFRGKKIENVYMEYWGLNTPKYLEIKEYKLKIYKRNNCTLISLYPEDLYDSENSLTMKLTQFIDRQINYEKE